jgi:hypothetical protein
MWGRMNSQPLQLYPYRDEAFHPNPHHSNTSIMYSVGSCKYPPEEIMFYTVGAGLILTADVRLVLFEFCLHGSTRRLTNIIGILNKASEIISFISCILD